MKRIEILKTFLHGQQKFHAGEVRYVDEANAGYFCGLGWAKADDGQTAAPSVAPVTLVVQNGTLGIASPEVK